MKRVSYGFSPQRMNVNNRRSRAVTVPAISPASAIIPQKPWQKLRGGKQGSAEATQFCFLRFRRSRLRLLWRFHFPIDIRHVAGYGSA